MAKQKMTEVQAKEVEQKRVEAQNLARLQWEGKDWTKLFQNEAVKPALFCNSLVKQTTYEDSRECLAVLEKAFDDALKTRKFDLIGLCGNLLTALNELKPENFNSSGLRGADPLKNPKWAELPEFFAIRREEKTVVYKRTLNEETGELEKDFTVVEIDGKEVEAEFRYQSVSGAASDPLVFTKSTYKVDGWSIVREVSLKSETIDGVEVSEYVIGDKVKWTLTFEDTDFSGSEVMEAFNAFMKNRGKTVDSIGAVSDNVKALFGAMNNRYLSLTENPVKNEVSAD